jgi:hypothetical protein
MMQCLQVYKLFSCTYLLKGHYMLGTAGLNILMLAHPSASTNHSACTSTFNTEESHWHRARMAASWLAPGIAAARILMICQQGLGSLDSEGKLDGPVIVLPLQHDGCPSAAAVRWHLQEVISC